MNKENLLPSLFLLLVIGFNGLLKKTWYQIPGFGLFFFFFFLHQRSIFGIKSAFQRDSDYLMELNLEEFFSFRPCLVQCCRNKTERFKPGEEAFCVDLLIF